MLNKIIKLLKAKNLTVGIAESCTGGNLCNEITNFDESSEFFKLGIIAYSSFAKEKILKVKKSTLKNYGSVSSETAIEMAKNIKELAKTNIGIAITGIAGSSIEGKERGIIFIAISYENKTICREFKFNGNRKEIKERAVENALKMLKEIIAGFVRKMSGL